MRWVPPKDLRHAEIEAALQNPNSADDPAFALASNRVKIRLGG
jgi:hypothetical protein